MQSFPKKTPRNPSRSLNSHLSCVLYSEDLIEVRADNRVRERTIHETGLPLGFASVGDSDVDRLMAARRVRGATPGRVVRGRRTEPTHRRSSTYLLSSQPRALIRTVVSTK